MIELELEKTYLAKALPEGLMTSPSKELRDIYIPESAHHAILRIRQRGGTYEITKKEPLSGTDSSEQAEHTIKLTKEEFEAFENMPGKRLRKIRYYYDYNGRSAEVDVFQDDLGGLVLIDFEFKNVEDKNNFRMPDFCLADVTQDAHFAGGMLCGKKYSDIEPWLNVYGYYKII